MTLRHPSFDETINWEFKGHEVYEAHEVYEGYEAYEVHRNVFTENSLKMGFINGYFDTVFSWSPVNFIA